MLLDCIKNFLICKEKFALLITKLNCVLIKNLFAFDLKRKFNIYSSGVIAMD